MSEQIVGLIREFGFPVVVALWFMFRLEKLLERILTLLAALMQATALLAKSVDFQINYEKKTPPPDNGDSIP